MPPRGFHRRFGRQKGSSFRRHKYRADEREVQSSFQGTCSRGTGCRRSCWKGRSHRHKRVVFPSPWMCEALILTSLLSDGLAGIELLVGSFFSIRILKTLHPGSYHCRWDVCCPAVAASVKKIFPFCVLVLKFHCSNSKCGFSVILLGAWCVLSSWDLTPSALDPSTPAIFTSCLCILTWMLYFWTSCKRVGSNHSVCSACLNTTLADFYLCSGWTIFWFTKSVSTESVRVCLVCWVLLNDFIFNC